MDNFIAEIPTFLDGGGGIDFAAMQHVRDRLRAAGIRRYAVAGLIGEYNGLTLAAQQALLGAMSDERLVSGVFDAGTAKAAQRVQAHQAMGCRSHLVLPSYFFSLGHPQEILRHIQQLSQHGSRLIVVDSPTHARFSMPEALWPELLALPGVEAILSDCCLSGGGMPDGTYTGDAPLILGLQGAGCVSQLAFLYPALMLRLAQGKLPPQPVREAMLFLLRGNRHPAAALKHAALCLGLCPSDAAYPPVTPLTAQDKASIRKAAQIIAREEAAHG